MTKRAVWIFCFVVAVIAVASLAYRLALVTHFNSQQWKNAYRPGDFIDRRAMMSDVEIMFASGKLGTRDLCEKILGQPERTADDNPNIWYYNLGGESSASSPDTITWLELTFDDSQRLVSHRVTQELIVPDNSTMPPDNGSN